MFNSSVSSSLIGPPSSTETALTSDLPSPEPDEADDLGAGFVGALFADFVSDFVVDFEPALAADAFAAAADGGGGVGFAGSFAEPPEEDGFAEAGGLAEEADNSQSEQQQRIQTHTCAVAFSFRLLARWLIWTALDRCGLVGLALVALCVGRASSATQTKVTANSNITSTWTQSANANGTATRKQSQASQRDRERELKKTRLAYLTKLTRHTGESGNFLAKAKQELLLCPNSLQHLDSEIPMIAAVHSFP